MIDRAGLAEFLRRRRASLQPEDVGLVRAQPRRTTGLRRAEVASLCAMSTDYYTRIEQERGPRPSAQMIAAIAQGLHLSHDERDHLFRLAGHQPPAQVADDEHVSPGLQRILDQLADTPAEIITELGETLLQTPLGVALTGDRTSSSGPARSIGYRWFTDPATRELYAPEEHAHLSRLFASSLRRIVALRGPDSRAARLAELTFDRSEEFRRVWNDHEIGIRPRTTKRLVHPDLGALDLHCQTLLDPQRSHLLLVFTAAGGESHEKLQLLPGVGEGRSARPARSLPS